ncbi:MAG: methyltransferase type 11 [uncultured bacterium]|nr:MAG: methyltransferase type 11 [uncultured bacterium]
MSSPILFLWNHQQQRLIQIQNNHSSGYPFEINHENENYYSWVGLPGFYFTPPTEEALICMFSFYLQNMDRPTQKSILSQATYQESYSSPTELPALIDDYLYQLNYLITLKQDVVGIHPKFSYNHLFHSQLGNFLHDTKLDSGSILEMGCGEGRHLLFLKKNFPSMKVSGIEPTSSGVAAGVKAAAHWGLDINFHLMPGEQCPLPDNSFDVVFCQCVMMHSDINYKEIFQNMYRMSKRWIILIDCFPELWEQGTKRTLASITYFMLKNYNFNFYNSLLRNDLKLNYKILAAQRMKYGWNPLCEPSLVIIEKKG